MNNPEIPNNQEIEISSITENDLVELRKNPPTEDDLINFELECAKKSDGTKIHQIPGHINALRMILYIGQTNGWDDEKLRDFEECRRAIRIKLNDPTKYMDK